jgi:hypothetical protein
MVPEQAKPRDHGARSHQGLRGLLENLSRNTSICPTHGRVLSISGGLEAHLECIVGYKIRTWRLSAVRFQFEAR